MNRFSEKNQKKILLLVNLVVVVGVFLLLEILGAFLFKNPFAGPPGYLKGLRHFYTSYGRSIIQFNSDFAIYDPGVSYKLKPGKFRFDNVEFDVEFEVNSLGVRDDEASLDRPEIIVVGDSHAMGWGVAQDETFTSLIEKKIGRITLNSSVSSYGTAREMLMMDRVDTSALRYLIVQYCQNDYGENKSFLENNNQLPIMTPDQYYSLIAEHQKKSRYHPGKYATRLIPSLLRHMVKEIVPSLKNINPEYEDADEASLFVNALRHSKADLSRTTVIVFEVNGFADNDRAFIAKLEKLLAEDQGALKVKKIISLDLSEILTPEEYFLMDDHMTSKGHSKVAEKVIALLNG